MTPKPKQPKKQKFWIATIIIAFIAAVWSTAALGTIGFLQQPKQGEYFFMAAQITYIMIWTIAILQAFNKLVDSDYFWR